MTVSPRRVPSGTPSARAGRAVSALDAFVAGGGLGKGACIPPLPIYSLLVSVMQRRRCAANAYCAGRGCVWKALAGWQGDVVSSPAYIEEVEGCSWRSAAADRRFQAGVDRVGAQSPASVA